MTLTVKTTTSGQLWYFSCVVLPGPDFLILHGYISDSILSLIWAKEPGQFYTQRSIRTNKDFINHDNWEKSGKFISSRMTKMERKSCWGMEEEERDVKRGVKLEITGLHMGSAVSHVKQPQTPNSLDRTIYRFESLFYRLSPLPLGWDGMLVKWLFMLVCSTVTPIENQKESFWSVKNAFKIFLLICRPPSSQQRCSTGMKEEEGLRKYDTHSPCPLRANKFSCESYTSWDDSKDTHASTHPEVTRDG